MNEKLIDLANRLMAEGRTDDAAVVFSAVAALAPAPAVKNQYLSQPAPGVFIATRILK